MASRPPSLTFFLVVLVAAALYMPQAFSTSRTPLMNHRSSKTPVRLGLKRVDEGGNFTRLELLQRAIKRGKNRLERLSAMVKKTSTTDQVIQTAVQPGEGDFLIHLDIGTPPVNFDAIMDTGSDLIWTQCKPCIDCYQQSTPILDPNTSSSFSKLSCSSKFCEALSTSLCADDGCEYLYAYGDSSSTQGVMATETLTFGGKTTFPNIAFGCGEDNEGDGFKQAQGLVGLGRGPLSLVSQLGYGKFAYCLGSIDSSSSSLVLGSSPSLDKTSDSVLATPLSQNPSQQTFYYISLEGITVGDTLLPISKTTFTIKEDGSGGMIVDSGTTLTYLEESGYKLVKKAFISGIKLPVSDIDAGLDLCFDMPNEADIEVPKLIFHFSGADLNLPTENYLMYDSSMGLLCLMMGPSSGLSVFGNVQQQNFLILHDLDKETMSFVPHQCD
ncbi:aspartic proteinase nepenthesin-1 [Macadamia integrifolia]|uniref:aspartic proteinase nepenthesin-1 n=1 Tax=Macadamia integrifolia TaxID=60698 RepID=UPI001C4FF4D0|nr:aspartic proteinase nepenthesin-1 [Macadamia integrifolia]